MKILLVDDHLLFLEGLSFVLAKLPFGSDVELLEAHSPEQANQFLEAESTELELALVDLNFPHQDGLELVRTMTSRDYLVPVIVLSAEEDISRIKQALELGAMGFIPKSLGSDEILRAIMQVLDGMEYIPESIQARLAEAPAFSPFSEEGKTARREALGISKRQFDTLELLAKGMSNKQIAGHLFLSENTVKSHISVLFQLLGATNRTECILKAKQQELLQDD